MQERSPREVLAQLLARHAGKSILVAEDDRVNQALMLALLKAIQAQVTLAEDGEKALALAQEGQYALVLMDRQMPNMDGIEATRAIRQLPGWQHTPIVALTADALAEVREECLAAGMGAFLTKPVDPDALYALLLELLDAQQAQ